MVALLAIGCGPVAAQQPLGPLHTAEQNPLYRLFYLPQAESADVVDDGRTRFEFSTSYSNIHEASRSASHRQLFDREQMTNVLAVRYGLRPSLEVGASVAAQTGWGGFLDPFVSGFHRALGLPNGGRELEPENQHVVRLERSDSSAIVDLPPRTLEREDLRVFAKWRILGSGDAAGALSLRGSVRRSAGGPEAGRTDGAVAVLARGSVAGLHAHGALGASTLSPPASLEPVSDRTGTFFHTSLEWPVRPGLSFLGQFSGTSRYVKGFGVGELDRLPLTLGLGLAGDRGDGWDWELGFVEDLPANSPSVDFTVHFGLARTF